MAGSACHRVSTFVGVLGEHSINVNQICVFPLKVRQVMDAPIRGRTIWIEDLTCSQVKPDRAVFDLILRKWNDDIKDWVVFIRWNRTGATSADINKAVRLDGSICTVNVGCEVRWVNQG